MKMKNKIAGLALALGATIAPLSAKATTETNTAPKTVELSKAEKKAKLKEAIHLGLSREELLKYVDFPEWMPTTKDGKFDSEKAKQMFEDAGFNRPENQKAFLDYATAVEKGENADIAFQKFAKQITNGDTAKMTALNKIKDTLQETQKRTNKKDMEENYGLGSYLMALLAVSALTTLGQKCIKNDLSTLSSMILSAGSAVAFGMGMVCAADGGLYKSYNRVSKEIYTAYTHQEIQKATMPEESKIIKMDMGQVKQFVEMAKQKSSTK